MPLITVQFTPAPAHESRVMQEIPLLISEIRERGALAFGGAPDNIWVIFESVPLALTSLTGDSRFPVVIVRAQAGRTRAQKNELARVIAETLGRGLGMSPKQVWIHYQEMDPQDVWFS